MSRLVGPTRETQGGFVLLEALLALILFSLTLGLFAMAFGFAQRVVDVGRVRSRGADFATGTDALSGWIAGALPIRTSPPDRPPGLLFEGTIGRLSFVTLSNGDAQPGGLLGVTIALDGARAVTFDAAPLPIGATALPETGAPQVLFGNTASLRFSYFGSFVEGGPAGWRDEWINAPVLPRLIAMRVALGLERGAETMTLTFRVENE